MKISRSTVQNVDAVNRLSIQLDIFTLDNTVIGMCCTSVTSLRSKKERKKLIKILAFCRESRALNTNEPCTQQAVVSGICPLNFVSQALSSLRKELN